MSGKFDLEPNETPVPHPATPTILAFAATAVASVACGTAAAQTPGNAEHARAELLVGVDAVAPGASFPVGVRVTTDPGWHVYWKYPGTAGLPTTVDWRLPDGFTVGELQYPTPGQFEQPGGIVGYGYEGSVLLTATATAPDDLAPGEPIPISADVAWLVCADVCIPGSATVEATVTTVAPGSKVGRDPTFDSIEAATPMPLRDDRAIRFVEAAGSLDAGRVDVTVHWNDPPADLNRADIPDGGEPIRWMPVVPDGLIAGPASVASSVAQTTRDGGPQVDPDTLQTTLGLPFDVYDRDAASAAIAGSGGAFETVLTYDDAGGRRRAVVIPVPLPDSSPATRPAR